MLEKLDLTKYAMEPKIDGWRILVRANSFGCDAWTRTGHDATQKLLGPLKQLQAFCHQHQISFILDCEAVAIRDDGVPDFNFTSRVLGSGDAVAVQKQLDAELFISLMAFDILNVDGSDIRHMPWDVRRDVLSATIFKLYDSCGTKEQSFVRLIDTSEATDDWHTHWTELWSEGSILKLRDAPYAGKRHKSWLKWKKNPTEDVVLIGFKPGEGKYEGQVGALEFGQYRLGMDTASSRGFCSGMTDEMRQKITNDGAILFGSVFEIKHNGILANGGFRHPQFIRFRNDKAPEECTWT
jgi:bifunctional non-homologous end joining protein LigD